MPARPLPYNLAVAATVATDRVNLQLSNRGRVGAVFHTRYRTADVAPGLHAEMFTVDARHHLSTTLPPSADGGFDLEVHGPNGFYRRLSGVAAPGPEVTTTAVESAQQLRLVLTNQGAAVNLTITDNRSGRRPITVYLRRVGSVSHIVGGHADGWYDVTIASGSDARFLRRLAGHIENRRSSCSDPSFGR